MPRSSESWGQRSEQQELVDRWKQKYSQARTPLQIQQFYAGIVNELRTSFLEKLANERIRQLCDYWEEASKGGPVPSTFLEELPGVAQILFERDK